MGMQFLAQAGQGVVQGAIAKSLAFGGEEGFDVQNLPSARYLLTVVLLLYGPYTLLSPFIGVCIDRFPRRSVVWIATLVAGGIVHRGRAVRDGAPGGRRDHRGQRVRDGGVDPRPPRGAGAWCAWSSP